MEQHIIGLLIVSSLIFNILIYRQLLHKEPVQIIERLIPIILDDSSQDSAQDQGSEAVTPVAEIGSQAWVNRTNIPLNEKVYAPATSKPAPVSGPLERPGGFV